MAVRSWIAGWLALFASVAPSVPGADLGRQNYNRHCGGCHGFDGSGNPEHGVPNMKGTVGHFLRLPEGRAFLVQVPGTSQAALDDAGIAELLNWLLKRFSAGEIPKDAPPYTKDEVTRLRAVKLSDVMRTRREIVQRLRDLGFAIK